MSDKGEQSSSDIVEFGKDEFSKSGIGSNDFWKRDDLISNLVLPSRSKRRPTSPRIRNKRAASSSVNNATKTTQKEAFRFPTTFQSNDPRAPSEPISDSSQTRVSSEEKSQSSQASMQYSQRSSSVSPSGKKGISRLLQTSWSPKSQQRPTQVSHTESEGSLERCIYESKEPEITPVDNRLSTPLQASLPRYYSAPAPSTSVPTPNFAAEASIDEIPKFEGLSSTLDPGDSEDAEQCIDEVLSEHGVSDMWTRNREAIKLKQPWVRIAAMVNIFQSDLGRNDKKAGGCVYVLQPADPRFDGFVKSASQLTYRSG